MPLGHPDAANVDGDGRDRPGGRAAWPTGDCLAAAEHELGRAAADVDHQVWRSEPLPARPGAGQLGRGAGEGQGRLLAAAQDLRWHAEDPGDPADELSGVRGVPGRARRYHPDGNRGAVSDDRRVLGQHAERPGQRIGGEAAGGVHPLAQPDDLHPAHQIGQRAPVRVGIGDEQAKRVGTAVDRRDANRAGLAAGSPGSRETVAAEPAASRRIARAGAASRTRIAHRRITHGRIAHRRIAHGRIAHGLASRHGRIAHGRVTHGYSRPGARHPRRARNGPLATSCRRPGLPRGRAGSRP